MFCFPVGSRRRVQSQRAGSQPRYSVWYCAATHTTTGRSRSGALLLEVVEILLEVVEILIILLCCVKEYCPFIFPNAIDICLYLVYLYILYEIKIDAVQIYNRFSSKKYILDQISSGNLSNVLSLIKVHCGFSVK